MPENAYRKSDIEGFNKGNFYISVIIPVYNDPDGIEDTLNSLVSQDYPMDNFEIIVADNGSTDNTINIINKYINRYPTLVHLVVEDKIQSSYAARNRGIESSGGSVIAFIDADMFVNSDWLAKIDRSFKKYKWDYLACAVDIYLNNKSIYGLYNKITGFPIEKYVNEGHYAPTCCLVVRKKIFEELGLFDSRLIGGGDSEFGTRVYKSGRKLYFDPAIVMMHPARSSFKGLFSKYFRIGRGNFQLTIRHPDKFRGLRKVYLNPLHYMPNIPWFIAMQKSKDDTWHELSFIDKTKVFLIDWLMRLIRNMGYFYEKLYGRLDL